MNQLVVNNLTKKYISKEKEITVLDNISFTINSGEFVCILGHSGCGKTTLLRILGGFDNLFSGTVLYDDTKITKPKMKYAMVFQDSNQLLPWKTAFQNIIYPIKINNSTGNKDCENEANKYLEMVGLKEYKNYYPNQLSSGMKQRIAIARALAMKPEVILMDEPFSSLDAQTRAKLHKEIINIWKKLNITFIFVTHDISEAIHLSTRVLMLSEIPAKIEFDLTNPVKGEKKANDEGYLEFWELLNDSIS